MTDLEYVTCKVKNKLFNRTELAKQTKVSRSTLDKIAAGEKVKEYVITALAVFFRKVSE